MELNEYQKLSAVTAVYPEHGQGTPLALAYVGLGLGEAGELQGKIKKILRDDGGRITNAKKAEILFEGGDVLWYLARIADELGTTLDEMARMNVAKLMSRKERGTLPGSGDHR